ADVAVAGPDEAARDLDERRLAGAVRAEQADELSLLDVEVDAVQRLDAPVSLAQAPDRERLAHAPDSTGLRARARGLVRTRLAPARVSRTGARSQSRQGHSSRLRPSQARVARAADGVMIASPPAKA